MKKNHLKRDLFLILLWPILASFLSVVLQVNYFFSTILFLGVPAAYLSYRNPSFIKKIALFSAAVGIPMAVVYDYIMEVTGGWFTTYSIFPWKILGYVMIEDIIWLFLWIYFVAIFYETFLDKKVTPKLYRPNMKYLVIIMFFIVAAFSLAYLLSPALLSINYFYAKASILLAFIPVALMLFSFPELSGRFLKIGAYFLLHSLIYEVTALNLGLWSFPAENQFLGFVSMFGVTFPFEEFFFWMILGAVTVITYYEFFDDDLK